MVFERGARGTLTNKARGGGKCRVSAWLVVVAVAVAQCWAVERGLVRGQKAGRKTASCTRAMEKSVWGILGAGDASMSRLVLCEAGGGGRGPR